MNFFSFLKANNTWVGSGALLAFLSGFGQTYFISLFADEIRSAFGLSHGQWGVIYTLSTSASAIFMIWAGVLTDRYRVKYLGAATLAYLALACGCMALISTVWLLPFVIFALRFAGQGMAGHITTVAMSRWFVTTRGKALSIAHLGFSIGEALLPLLVVFLISLYNWRSIWLWAALISLSGIPVIWIMLQSERTPQSISESTKSSGMLQRHWSRLETVRHWLFWLMIPALLGPSAFNTAFFFNQVYFAEIKGWSHFQLVALFPIYTAVSIAALLGSGVALDRFGTGRLISWFLLPITIAFLIFSVATTIVPTIIAFIFLGITTGMSMNLTSAFWAEFYGTRYLGAIKSLAAAVMVLGSAVGPGITGVMLDLGLGLETQYIGIAIYFFIATLMMTIGVKKAIPLLEKS